MKHGTLGRVRGRLGPIEFTSEELTRVAENLCSYFFSKILDFRIVVGGRKYSVSAEVDLNTTPSTIYMYKPYHDRYPQDYEVTLLHELGHILLGPTHEQFYQYWQWLFRKDVATQVVPSEYNKFLYARRTHIFRDRWDCPDCGHSRFYKKRMNTSKCACCKSLCVRDENFQPAYVEV